MLVTNIGLYQKSYLGQSRVSYKTPKKYYGKNDNFSDHKKV
jgi:hypothetical protein